MLILYRNKERRRIARSRNSINGSQIADGSITNSDIADEAIEYFHLAPNLASLLDTIRSGLTTLLGTTPMSTTPVNPSYSKTGAGVTVSWSHPQNSQSATPINFTTQLTLASGQAVYYVDSYELRYRIYGTQPWETVIDISLSTSHTFSIVNNFTRYEVQIRGRNDAVGASEWVDLSILAELNVTVNLTNNTNRTVTTNVGGTSNTLSANTTATVPITISSSTISCNFTVNTLNADIFVDSSNSYIYPNYFFNSPNAIGTANIILNANLETPIYINITTPLRMARIRVTPTSVTSNEIILSSFNNNILQVPISINNEYSYFSVTPSASSISLVGTVPSSSILAYIVSGNLINNSTGVQGAQNTTMGAYSVTSTTQSWYFDASNSAPLISGFTMVDIDLTVTTMSRGWHGRIFMELLSLRSNTITTFYNYTIYKGATTSSPILETNSLSNSTYDSVVTSLPITLQPADATSSFLVVLGSSGGGDISIVTPIQNATLLNVNYTLRHYIIVPTANGTDVRVRFQIESS